MRTIGAAILITALPASAFAQALVQPQRFDRAPWWMDQPVIASMGMVEAEVRANRANFSASFQSVAKTAAEATKASADKVRELGRQLATYGVDKVQIETTFNMRPIYDQYRDRDGNLIANQRADKIDAYEVNANVSVQVRDVELIERVYATVLAAQPTSTQQVTFSLEPGNAVKTELYGLAVADAARRAKLATDATGARLGPVKLIDPTGRACATDVLVAGAEQDAAEDYTSSYDVSGSLQDVVVVGARASRPAPPPPPPPPPPAPAPGSALDPAQMQLPLQPPLQKLSDYACVVYTLAG